MAEQLRHSGFRTRAAQTKRAGTVTLDDADLAALLEVIRAHDPGELQRRGARLRALLGPSADRLEPHLQALRARMHELQHAQHLAATDALTGLANRRSFSDALRRELARSRRNGTALSVVMLDLDDFKRINDTLGHAAGDQVLRMLARCAREHTRQGDLAARLGGDEIALLLPETDASAARDRPAHPRQPRARGLGPRHDRAAACGRREPRGRRLQPRLERPVRAGRCRPRPLPRQDRAQVRPPFGGVSGRRVGGPRKGHWPAEKRGVWISPSIPVGGQAMTRLIEREWLSFAAALLILLGVAALSYSSAIAAEGTLASVEHTGHALERIESINADFARAVTARRAFIIAGDRSQLRDVPKLDATVRRSLAVVREHVSDDPSQRRDLDTLARAIDERLADLDASVERRERTGTGANDPGEIPLSTRVRSIRERMVAEENRRLAERSASTRQQLSVTRITVLAGVAVSIAILALAFHRMRREIERRKRSEVTLAEKEAFLDTIVESVPDMLTVKSAADLRIERVNRAGETLLDHKREDILGKRDPEILGHVEAEASEAHDRHALAACVAVETTEEVLQTHDGARWLHTRRVPILDETGRPRHLLRISEDVTERRKMLETLERAKLAAEAANEGLREARAAADAANQAKSEFLSSMSHEVRTPLNAILGFAQLLQRDKKEPLSNRHMDRVGRILTAGGHLLRLIDDILDLSRIEAGRVPLSIEPIALKDALSEVKTDLEEMATRFQIRVEVAPIPGELPRILADRTRLAQILVNFGSNAIKYNRPSGVVTFSATVPSADQIRVTVRDTGLGVSEAKQAQLFQPFQRAGHENGPIEGTGIGLVVTKRLAEAMRGGVGFRSVPGEGSEFWVDLPIHPAKESPAFA